MVSVHLKLSSIQFVSIRSPPYGATTQKLLRFPTRTGLFGSKPYLTLLSIDDHNLYYQGRDRVSLPEASRRGIMLYDLK